MAPSQGPANLGDVSYSSGYSSLVFTLFVAAGSAYIIVSKIAGFGVFAENAA